VIELLYGKPSETVDVDATLVDPLRIREMTPGERAVLMRRLLDDHPQLAELVPERLRPVDG
jgi:hypothetical protein